MDRLRLLFSAISFSVLLTFICCAEPPTPASDLTPSDLAIDSSSSAPIRLGTDPSPHQTLAGTIRIRTLDSTTGTIKQHLLFGDNGERTILHFEKTTPLKTGDRVLLNGSDQGDGHFAVFSLTRLDRHLRRLDAPLVRKPMVHRTAILAMQEAAVSKEEALQIFNGSTDSLQHFYREVTYGTDTFADAVFRKYDINYKDSDCKWDNTYNISDALMEAFQEDGNKVSDYDHIVCVVPRSCGSDWSGAWSDTGGISDKGALNFELISMYKDNAFNPWYLAHELGHSLGMDHSRSIDCGSALYRPNAKGCAIDEYGNFNDVMGWGEGVYFSAPFQRYLGWISPSTVLTAAKSDVFNLQPVDGAMCGLRTVRIPIPEEAGSYFYLEYRKARADSHYAGTGAVAGGNPRLSPVLLTVSRDGKGGAISSPVDRVELGTSTYRGALVGTRYELGKGVAIEVVDAGGQTAQVKVEMAGGGQHKLDDNSPFVVESDGTIGPYLCHSGGDGDSDIDTDVDGDTDSDSDTDINKDVDAGSDADTEIDQETDTNLDSDGEIDTEPFADNTGERDSGADPDSKGAGTNASCKTFPRSQEARPSLFTLLDVISR